MKGKGTRKPRLTPDPKRVRELRERFWRAEREKEEIRRRLPPDSPNRGRREGT